MGKEISIRIDGDVNVKKRQNQIDSFQTGEQKRVALLSLDAASVGFSLTASSTVFFAELAWTPSGLMQAEDRCHRMGQRSKVTCHYFIAKGSLDEAMLKLVQDKYKDLRLVSEFIARSNSLWQHCEAQQSSVCFYEG